MAAPAPKFERAKRWADARETAAYLKLSPDTLKNKRSDGTGPPFVRIGRKILYDLDAADVWMLRYKRTSTRERAEFLV